MLYSFTLFGKALEVKYKCAGRSVVFGFGDGELYAIEISGKYKFVPIDQVYAYCRKVAQFFATKYRQDMRLLEKRGEWGKSYFLDSIELNTKVHLFCQTGMNTRNLVIDIEKENPYR